LAVYEDGWLCHGACQEHGDAIDWLRKYRQLSLKDACAFLGHSADLDRGRGREHRAPRRTSASQSDCCGLDDPAWQEAAINFCQASQNALWSARGYAARGYLRLRGIDDETIRRAALGYNAKYRKQQWGAVTVHMPQDSIVIPWWIGGKLWRVKARPLPREIESQQRRGQSPNKYWQAKGGANGMYGVDDVVLDSIVLLVEGELDAITWRSVLAQYARIEAVGALKYEESEILRHIVPLATGSAGNGLTDRWLLRLAVARRVLLAFDADDAGDKAAQVWAEHLVVKTTRLRPYSGKDTGEMFKLLGAADVLRWTLDTLQGNP
jgi:hypothetical protein